MCTLCQLPLPFCTFHCRAGKGLVVSLLAASSKLVGKYSVPTEAIHSLRTSECFGGRVRLSPGSVDEEQHRRKSDFVSLRATDTGPLRLSHAVFFGHHLLAGINLPVASQMFLTKSVLRLTRVHTCSMCGHSFSTSLPRLYLKNAAVLQSYLHRKGKVCFGVHMWLFEERIPREPFL